MALFIYGQAPGQNSFDYKLFGTMNPYSSLRTQGRPLETGNRIGAESNLWS